MFCRSRRRSPSSRSCLLDTHTKAHTHTHMQTRPLQTFWIPSCQPWDWKRCQLHLVSDRNPCLPLAWFSPYSTNLYRLPVFKNRTDCGIRVTRPRYFVTMTTTDWFHTCGICGLDPNFPVDQTTQLVTRRNLLLPTWSQEWRVEFFCWQWKKTSEFLWQPKWGYAPENEARYHCVHKRGNPSRYKF